jgi:hypothetical protein
LIGHDSKKSGEAESPHLTLSELFSWYFIMYKLQIFSIYKLIYLQKLHKLLHRCWKIHSAMQLKRVLGIDTDIHVKPSAYVLLINIPLFITMLQAGRSPVRVSDEADFSIYLILPAILWPGG